MDAYTFSSGINAVRNAGAIPVGIAMDEDGMIPEALAEAAKSGKGKYIYLIPNFQNPTGITMPSERRHAIYEVARQYDLAIYEDDPYGEIRFTDTIEPTFKSFDVDNRVVYAGSYSKTIAAGLRVGYLYGPAEIIDPIQVLRQNPGLVPHLFCHHIAFRLRGSSSRKLGCSGISSRTSSACREGTIPYSSSLRISDRRLPDQRSNGT